MDTQYVVSFGTSFGGDITLYGPFDTSDDALHFAEDSGDHDWEIIPVYPPEKD